MTSYLPQRISYKLTELEKSWGVERADLQQWMTQGELIVHAWVPLMAVFRSLQTIEASRIKLNKELSYWEGHINISKHCCYRILKYGRSNVREFVCNEDGYKYALPETAKGIKIEMHDVVILRDERMRFEQEHCIKAYQSHRLRKPQSKVTPYTEPSITIGDVSFKTIHLEGRDYYFGNIQADILRQLYEASKTDNPWCSGKQLLKNAGSSDFKLSNTFKRNPIWKRLVTSDGRGCYRLNSRFVY